ncbi:MAG: hypothetical protein GKS07_01995 [Nitrosopumilus sp.]|nr:MAG: hypothetical protein GKS07_01995 [Nitrosopumilus sp.]
MKKYDNVELLFSKEELDETYKSKGIPNIPKKFAASIEDVQKWFKQFEIETIELWISGAIETDGILKLAVSARGEGGMKITLKPKSL